MDALSCKLSTRRGVRIIYVTLGLSAVGLGVLGAVLPVLPMTPFLLVALWAFSRSSVRLETWLITHRVFGPRLVAWRTHRAIPLSVKLTSWGSMVTSLSLLVLGGATPIAIVGAAAVMAVGATYIALRPSRSPSTIIELGADAIGE